MSIQSTDHFKPNLAYQGVSKNLTLIISFILSTLLGSMFTFSNLSGVFASIWRLEILGRLGKQLIAFSVFLGLIFPRTAIKDFQWERYVLIRRPLTIQSLHAFLASLSVSIESLQPQPKSGSGNRNASQSEASVRRSNEKGVKKLAFPQQKCWNYQSQRVSTERPDGPFWKFWKCK